MSIESHEQPTSYLSPKLRSIHNMNNWELYILEKHSICPDVGQAIRRGVPFDPARPTTNDLFPGTALRMYSFLPTDLTTLDPPSLLDFRSAVKTFDKLERLRREEVCHLLISSFSEDAKMLLRPIPSDQSSPVHQDLSKSHAIYRDGKSQVLSHLPDLAWLSSIWPNTT